MKQSLFIFVFIFVLTGCHQKATQTTGHITPLQPEFETIISKDAQIEVIAEGFEWCEGPVWWREKDKLLFTDVPRNTIYEWSQDHGLAVYLRPSGYTGDNSPGFELGANGLLFDATGHLVMCDHGNRCIARLNIPQFTKTVLAKRVNGKRFNSPNDAVRHSNGTIYFTDPPYGLDGLNKSPLKEIPFNGVYRLATDGTVTLLTRDMTFPNGIGFSPDEKTLYVANSDPELPVWKKFDVTENGLLTNGRIFYDATKWLKDGKKGLPDGLAVDHKGRIFATGPDGVIVFSPDGEPLGVIETGQATSNCTFGGDGSVLYITADMVLCRIRTLTKGTGYTE